MGKQEGIDLLLQAVQLIVKHLGRTDIHFGLVGGGTELPAMRQLARDLGIGDYVTFTGRAPDAVLLEMLCTADICVNPDRANEMNDRSTMNKVMEYMALGKPLVQFDLTEGRVSAGEAAWYARPNDVADLAQKMVALLADERQRLHMGVAGRERIERVLSWQHEAPRLLAAYEHLTGEKP
jgi:glycosyltransferase involved in cell wall biosynthesis